VDIGEQEVINLSIIQAFKIIIISVKEALELDSFLCICSNKGNSGAQVYMKGLFKNLKITLRHTFFSARCAAFWNGLDDSTVSAGIIAAFSGC